MPSSGTTTPTAAPTLPPEMSARVRSISTQLDGVRAHIAPLLKLPIQSTMTSLDPMERARLQVALGFAVNALFFIWLKSRGENPSEHPVKKELDRIRTYLKKIKSAEATMKENARKQEVRDKHDLPPTASIAFVNSTVAKRTVERTLGIKRKSAAHGDGSSESESVLPAKRKKKNRTTKSTTKTKRKSTGKKKR